MEYNKTQHVSGKRMLGAGVLVAVLVALDQITKYFAVLHLQGKPSYVIWEGIFELEYLENRGAAFGILQNRQWLFILLFFVLLLLLGYIFSRMPAQRHYFPLRIIALVVIAGGIGNLIDRIRLGYVVDFFYFSLIDFPIFNVADIYVTVSMALLFILIIFYYKDEDFNWLFGKGGN